MDSEHGKTRMNVECDRISILPDDLIHKVLSFIGIKHAIETSALSSRWRFIWTSMPYLNFSSDDFLDLPKFHKFVTKVLSRRNNQTEVSSVKIGFRENKSWVFVKRILRYAFSHNVQQLTIACLLEKKIKFPLALFNSQSLKNLTLTGSTHAHLFMSVSNWDLLALTTLHLDYVTLHDYNDKCVGLFSKCTNLKNLTLNHCIVAGSDVLCICHPQLNNLALENVDGSMIVVNVVAPQLVNLTVKNCIGEHVVSAPNLVSLLYKGHYLLQFCVEGVCYLEKVDLCICNPYKEDPHKIIGMLQQFHNVKFLTLNSGLVEFLSSSMELISDQSSPFANLKSLKIHPDEVFWEVQETVSTEVVNYLLNSSPTATFTMVSREEIRAVWKAIQAQNLMVDLRVLLEQLKATTGTNMAHMHKQGKAQVNIMQLDMCTRMARINYCWEEMSLQIEQGKKKTCGIVSKLRRIEGLLTELPASKRAKIQPCFSSLCAEANTVMNKIMDCMKIQCDEKQGRLSACFRELASTSQPPS